MSSQYLEWIGEAGTRLTEMLGTLGSWILAAGGEILRNSLSYVDGVLILAILIGSYGLLRAGLSQLGSSDQNSLRWHSRRREASARAYLTFIVSGGLLLLTAAMFLLRRDPEYLGTLVHVGTVALGCGFLFAGYHLYSRSTSQQAGSQEIAKDSPFSWAPAAGTSVAGIILVLLGLSSLGANLSDSSQHRLESRQQTVRTLDRQVGDALRALESASEPPAETAEVRAADR